MLILKLIDSQSYKCEFYDIKFVSFALTVNVLVEMDAEEMAECVPPSQEYFQNIGSTVYVGDVLYVLINRD